MKNRSYLVLIPARFQSSRFPGKPLALIHGKSMVQRLVENLRPKLSSEKFKIYICVVTDDQRIEDHLRDLGENVVRVDDDVKTGSERVFLAYQRYFKDKSFDLIINIQGDEPLFTFDELKRLINFHLNSSFDITTMVDEKIGYDDEFKNPNNVKAIVSEVSGQCLYFSRAQIPHDRENEHDSWFLHIGIYSYRPECLEAFNGFVRSHYENIEKLEQLRALENGQTIGAIKTKISLYGVDVPEDIKKIEGVLSGQ